MSNLHLFNLFDQISHSIQLFLQCLLLHLKLHWVFKHELMKLLRWHTINWWFLWRILIIVLALNDAFILILPVNEIQIVLPIRIHLNWAIVVVHFLNKIKFIPRIIKNLLYIALPSANFSLLKSSQDFNKNLRSKIINWREKNQNTNFISLLSLSFLEKSPKGFFILGSIVVFLFTISSTFSFNFINLFYEESWLLYILNTFYFLKWLVTDFLSLLEKLPCF